MIQLTLNFNTPEEAMDALAKLSGKACTCDDTQVAPAPTNVIPMPAPAAAPPAPAAAPPAPAAAPPAPAAAPPAPAAAPPAPAATVDTAPPAAAPPAPPAMATPTTTLVTLQDLNNLAVAKATQMADNGQAVIALIQSFGVKGLSELPAEQYPAFIEKLNQLGV